MQNIVSAFFDILYFLILIRIILSFFPVNPYGNPLLLNVVQFFRQVTEPFLAPFRSLIPPVRMGGGYMDLSPIVALIVLGIVRRILMGIL